LSEAQKQANPNKSNVRAPKSNMLAFGSQAAMGGHLVRTIDLQRAKVKIGLI
jgi:hypothetical protein